MDSPFTPDEPVESLQRKSLVERLPRSIRAVGPTMGANLLNQAVVALSQVVVIPLLVAKWGLAGYGTWLLLTAIPTYLAISDLGFATSAKSDMTLRVAQGDSMGARVTVSSVAALLGCSLLLLGVLYFALVLFVDWPRLLKLDDVGLATAQSVLTLGFVQIGAYQAFLLSASVFRAAGKPATEVLLSALFRTIETAALVGAALLGGNLVAAAAAWAIARVATTLWTWRYIARHHAALTPTFGLLDLTRIRQLLPPSMGYMLVPLANAVSIQGAVLVLGTMSSPAVVASFTVARVVSRLGMSIALMVNNSFTPQYSYIAAQNDRERYSALLRTHVLIIAIIEVVYFAGIIAAAPLMIDLVSHGTAAPSMLIVALLSLAVVAEIAWGTSMAIASATNAIGRMSIVWVLLAVLGLAVEIPAIAAMGEIGAATAVLSTHVVMAIYAVGRRLRRTS